MNKLPQALFAAALCFIAIIFFGWFMFFDTTQEPVESHSNYVLNIDTSNAALMHSYGLPTKADCMEYHVHGQWGYYIDGMLYAYDRLPGLSESWDSLYEIDSDNPGFDK